MTVRTRVAPSPTGDPHVGTAYVALFNYCFARRHGGQFILRIEDTDRERSNPGSEAMILRSLRWLGLDWDEGPDVGGPHGPYRQSERGDIYREHARRLLDEGHAFRCFCTAERLQALRAQQQAEKRSVLGYDGHCAGISAEAAERRAAEGEPFVVRMKVPREGRCVVNDLLRGEIVFEYEQVDMQVLLKADGFPTYHLANVVDDHLMGITHILRGEEWISSAPKHMLLYGYFGWPAPQLCHLPLLRNPDHSKLSKRKNPTSLLYYERMGFLPEALLNYLGRMAWSLPDDREKFSLAEMVSEFDVQRISLGGPIFDIEKLAWLSGRWIREDLSVEEYAERVRRWALNSDYLMRIAPLTQQRVERLSDLEPLTGFFFRGLLDIPAEVLVFAKLERERVLQLFDAVVARVDPLVEWNRDTAHAAVNGAAEELGMKLRDALKPLYVALTGKPSGVPLFDAMDILGKDLCRARIRHARATLASTAAAR
ncbi:MAG TPA: glutamate--tRNA ligase [Longimicrobiaceae bacterium]|nr:glutamate--tRNA ligase [Longimicrobiaceae bacterium]